MWMWGRGPLQPSDSRHQCGPGVLPEQNLPLLPPPHARSSNSSDAGTFYRRMTDLVSHYQLQNQLTQHKARIPDWEGSRKGMFERTAWSAKKGSRIWGGAEAGVLPTSPPPQDSLPPSMLCREIRVTSPEMWTPGRTPETQRRGGWRSSRHPAPGPGCAGLFLERLPPSRGI